MNQTKILWSQRTVFFIYNTCALPKVTNFNLIFKISSKMENVENRYLIVRLTQQLGGWALCIIHYFIKNYFPCAFFGENWSNAGNHTFLFSHWKTWFTLVIGSLRLTRITRKRKTFRRWGHVTLVINERIYSAAKGQFIPCSCEGQHPWTKSLSQFSIW